ncbi:MAG: hypothetical protein J6T24_02855 [Clostridia bacterium]|nr:hypothetical protein [Clostridia bacterium]
MEQFCQRLGLSAEQTSVLLSTVSTLEAPLGDAVERYLADTKLTAPDAAALLYGVREDIHPYTKNAAFVLSCFFRDRESFIAECGEEIFYDTARDLLYKLQECERRYGIVGSSAISWHNLLLRRSILTLGRLQFHTVAFPFDDYRGVSHSVKKGDTIIKMHIPSSGKLREEDCLDSYRRAYRYFRPQFDSDVIPFACFSWLLAPELRVELAGGGIAAFSSHFTIFRVSDIPENGDLWRVFGKDYTDPREMPRGTRLQAVMADRVARGEAMQCGYGLFAHDGERVLLF